jgi:hypothetical protein
MTMWLRSPTPADMLHVSENMRPDDAREVFAIMRGEDRVRLAYQLYGARHRAWVFLLAGLDNSANGAAFLGIWPMDETEGLATAGMFATADFPLLAGPLVRHVRRVIMPDLLARGVRRVEARAMATYRTTRRFLSACGAVCERANMPEYGKNGESFALYAWRRSDWEVRDVSQRVSEAGGGGIYRQARRRRR